MSLKKCCCHYAPTIIVLDLVMLLILIGEFVLVFPNKQVSLLDKDGLDEYGLPKQPTINSDFNYSAKGLDIQKFNLWEGSSYAVFVIPINTFLICLGMRLLFCKINVEVMKFILIIDLLLIYVSTILGLILYLTASQSASNASNFKEHFFLQYIIMAVSLVLGFLSQFIALLLLSCSFMKSMRTSISENASYYQEEIDGEANDKLLASGMHPLVGEGGGPVD